jgi:hypothetical protein
VNHRWQTQKQRMARFAVKAAESTHQPTPTPRPARAISENALPIGVVRRDEVFERDRVALGRARQALASAMRDEREFALFQKRWLGFAVDRHPTLPVNDEMKSNGALIGRDLNAPTTGEIRREVNVSAKAQSRKHVTQKIHLVSPR